MHNLEKVCIGTGEHHSDMFAILEGAHFVKTGYINLYAYIYAHTALPLYVLTYTLSVLIQ